MLLSPQVSREDKANAHCVSAVLCHVDRSLDRAAELEAVHFDGYDLDEWHLDDELLGMLHIQAVCIHVPSCSLQVQALDVGAMRQAFFDVGSILLLCDLSVHHTLVERPVFGAACRLDEGCRVRLWDVEATQPDDFGFFNFSPVFVLSISVLEVLDPVDQILERLRSERLPLAGHEAIEDGVCHLFELLRHTDLTIDCSPEVEQ